MQNSHSWIWEGTNGPIPVYREKRSEYKKYYLWAEVIRLNSENFTTWTVIVNHTKEGEITRFYLKTKKRMQKLSPKTISVEISKHLKGINDGTGGTT